MLNKVPRLCIFRRVWARLSPWEGCREGGLWSDGAHFYPGGVQEGMKKGPEGPI